MCAHNSFLHCVLLVLLLWPTSRTSEETSVRQRSTCTQKQPSHGCRMTCWEPQCAGRLRRCLSIRTAASGVMTAVTPILSRHLYLLRSAAHVDHHQDFNRLQDSLDCVLCRRCAL